MLSMPTTRQQGLAFRQKTSRQWVRVVQVNLDTRAGLEIIAGEGMGGPEI